MKKIILSLLVLMLACQLSAQNTKHPEKVAIGLRIGGNLASYKYTDNPAYDTLGFDTDFMKRVRPMLGINADIPLFGSIMYVSPEVSITGRGDSRVFMNSILDTLVRYQVNVYYLEARLPIQIAIPITPNFKPYVFASPSFGLAMNGKIQQYSLDKAKTKKLNQSVAIDSSNMAPKDYGLTLGAGLRFRINFSSFAMIMKVEGGYYMGFLDTYSEQEITNQSQAVGVNAYNVKGKRLNRGIEASFTIAIPLDFHSEDDCFYWSDIERRKNKSRGLYGF